VTSAITAFSFEIPMYVYSPGEPAGNPTQPVPDLRDPLAFSLNQTTRGRCGICAACPKYWDLYVPLEDEPYAGLYAGVVRLQRQPYRRFSLDGDFTRYENCCWEQILQAEDSLQLNTYTELPFTDGWYLVWGSESNEGSAWRLYTPYESAGTNPIIGHRSKYIYSSDQKTFNCLGGNNFRLDGEAAERAFVYTPENLTIIPVYG